MLTTVWHVLLSVVLTLKISLGVVWCGVVGVVNKSPGLGGGHTSPATP